MKTTRIFALGVLCAGLTFFACQKDDLAIPTNGNAKVTPRSHDCAAVCIDPDAPVYHEDNFANAVEGSRNIVASGLNTLAGFVVEWEYDGGSGNRRVSVTVSGAGFSAPQNQTSANGAEGASGTYTFNFDASWSACGVVTVVTQFLDGDFAAKGVAGGGTYQLVGECVNCETSFTGDGISCGNSREAVYTFTSVDELEYVKIQGGLTNFVDGGDAIVTVAGGDGVEITQVTQGGSSNRRITVEFAADACEEVTIHITWNSTNNGGIITGDWSAKDEDGFNLAPEVPGLDCD